MPLPKQTPPTHALTPSSLDHVRPLAFLTHVSLVGLTCNTNVRTRLLHPGAGGDALPLPGSLSALREGALAAAREPGAEAARAGPAAGGTCGRPAAERVRDVSADSGGLHAAAPPRPVTVRCTPGAVSVPSFLSAGPVDLKSA